MRYTDGASPIGCNAVPMAHIKLSDVSVEFQVLNADSTSLRAHIVHISSGGSLKRDARNNVSVLALDRLSMEAREGDRIGLVGRNGAGKSTLLRLLAGIIAPTQGNVFVDGTAAALLGSTLGLDEDLTGYESIRYGCLLMGLSERETRNALPEIAAFTELGDYLAMPVRTYSSGMRVRLSFAIATCHQPDILLIDEMIGAGDAHFVGKAKQRAAEFMGRSSIVILASHSEDIIRTVCNKAILLDQGHVVIAGNVDEVLSLYGEIGNNTDQKRARPRGKPFGSNPAPTHPVEHAFDGKLSTRWEAGSVRGLAFLGIDFGEGQTQEARGFTIRQWHGGDRATTIDRVHVEASDDGFRSDIRRVCTVAIAPTIQRATYPIEPSQPSQYWRLVAASETGGGPWAVCELEFLEGGDEALLASNQARVFGSGHTRSHGPKHAFDGWLKNFWCSTFRGDEVTGNAYLGVDFGPGNAVEIRRFKLRQWDGGARPNTVFSIRVQMSSDEFRNDVHEAGAILVPQDNVAHVHHLGPSAPARYWRILANSPTGGGHWGVSDLEFSSQFEPDLGAEETHDAPRAGNAISGGEVLPHRSSNAFDGDPTTYWLSFQPGPYLPRQAYLGYDFGQGRTVEVRRFVIQQFNSGAPPNMIDSVVIQCSNDHFAADVTTVATVAIDRNTLRNAYDLPPSRQARYWRIVANGVTGPGDAPWAVALLEFWDESGRRAGQRPKTHAFASA